MSLQRSEDDVGAALAYERVHELPLAALNLQEKCFNAGKGT
jgi:hypothetical protein